MRDSFAEMAEGCVVQADCIVGLKYRADCSPVRLGRGAHLRAGTIIYGDVTVGEDFQTGHHVTVREKTVAGDHVVIGTNTVVNGSVSIGNFVKIESNCYIPTHCVFGSRIFLGPGVTILNDRYPLRRRDEYRPEGCTVEDNVTIGGGVVLLPGVRIGAGSFIAAGAVVTKEVPPATLVIGVPGRHKKLPEELNEPNTALSWRAYISE